MSSKQAQWADATSDPNTDRAEMLRGCRAGDRRAQQQVYELCHRQVFGLMLRMVGAEDAEDVTQQVFLQLFRKIDQFAGRSKFSTWVYRVAVNEAIQHLRRRSRRKHQAYPHEPMSPHHHEEERAEQKELLEVALSRIEPELSSIFLLREVEGLSYHEIATALNIPEGTVGSRLNRARNELQTHLRGLGWEA